jgi:Trypsin-like peptidase domain
MRKRLLTLFSFFLVIPAGSVATSQAPTEQKKPSALPLTKEQALQKLLPSLVLVLAGAEDGKLSGVATGVIVRQDGVILTTFRTMKAAKKVQVRLANGDVYNHVELLDFDERHGIAALRVRAANLPVLDFAFLEDVVAGEPVQVISNPQGAGLVAQEGTIGELARADREGPGEKSETVFKISVPTLLRDSSIVIDGQARGLGLIVEGEFQNYNFMVPLQAVSNLKLNREGIAYSKGEGLRLQSETAALANAPKAALPPGGIAEIVRNARTVSLYATGSLIPVTPVEKKLLESKEFQAWGLVVLKDEYNNADLLIHLDRPVLTWDFTFSITDPKTNAVVGSGKVIAWDGVRAAPGLAEEIIKRLKTYRPVPDAQKSEVKSQN